MLYCFAWILVDIQWHLNVWPRLFFTHSLASAWCSKFTKAHLRPCPSALTSMPTLRPFSLQRKSWPCRWQGKQDSNGLRRLQQLQSEHQICRILLSESPAAWWHLVHCFCLCRRSQTCLTGLTWHLAWLSSTWLHLAPLAAWSATCPRPNVLESTSRRDWWNCQHLSGEANSTAILKSRVAEVSTVGRCIFAVFTHAHLSWTNSHMYSSDWWVSVCLRISLSADVFA